eukprot:SAG31_NODE_8195_length_1498_cov_1.918513_3_plen_75_part_01
MARYRSTGQRNEGSNLTIYLYVVHSCMIVKVHVHAYTAVVPYMYMYPAPGYGRIVETISSTTPPPTFGGAFGGTF